MIAFEQVYPAAATIDIMLNVVGVDGSTLLFAATAGPIVDNGAAYKPTPTNSAGTQLNELFEA